MKDSFVLLLKSSSFLKFTLQLHSDLHSVDWVHTEGGNY